MSRETYEQDARRDYADVIDLFHEAVTINSDIEHTGGGCLAVRVWLGADWYALVTSDGGPLPADRPHGWTVGIYSCAEEYGHHRAGCEGWVVYDSTDPDPARMVDEVAPLLRRIAAGERVS